MSGRVIVVGSANADLVVRSGRLPGPGETTTGGTFEQHQGGKGANQAVAAARLGAEVRFIGAVGSDSFGSEARASLAAAGVDLAGLATLDGEATGIALILVDRAGENLIAVASGANWALGESRVEDALASLRLLAGDVVLVANELAPAVVAAALRSARAAGARTILNPAPADPFDPSLLELVDILTPNHLELAALAGSGLAGSGLAGSSLAGSDSAAFDLVEAARSLAAGEAVIVTLGSGGALVVPRDGPPRSVAAIPVEAIDTTGAGDAFNGALAAALADDMPLGEAVRRAVAAGGLATTRVGAREGMPTAAELAAVLGQAPPG
ncbi:MAG: ribokinase [Candidatus Limnocylindrales bacterium]